MTILIRYKLFARNFVDVLYDGHLNTVDKISTEMGVYDMYASSALFLMNLQNVRGWMMMKTWDVVCSSSRSPGGSWKCMDQTYFASLTSLWVKDAEICSELLSSIGKRQTRGWTGRLNYDVCCGATHYMSFSIKNDPILCVVEATGSQLSHSHCLFELCLHKMRVDSHRNDLNESFWTNSCHSPLPQNLTT